MKESEGFSDIRRVLQEMQEEYWRGIEESVDAAVVETQATLVFRLGAERFGVPSTAAKEVLRLPRLIRVPRLSAHFLGVFNLRGQIIAVTDLRPLLGLASGPQNADGHLLVVEAAGVTTALLTEGVEGLRELPLAAIEPMTEGLAGFPRDVADGQVHLDDGLLVLLSLERILARPDFLVNDKGL